MNYSAEYESPESIIAQLEKIEAACEKILQSANIMTQDKPDMSKLPTNKYTKITINHKPTETHIHPPPGHTRRL